MLNFPESDIDLRERGPLVLAFVGDGVLEMLVRAHLVAHSRLAPGALHRLAIGLVSAKGQHAALQRLQPHLTERELLVVRRGRNASKATVPKNAGAEEYRASTALEALFGWLYLQNEHARVEELFEILWTWYSVTVL